MLTIHNQSPDLQRPSPSLIALFTSLLGWNKPRKFTHRLDDLKIVWYECTSKHATLQFNVLSTPHVEARLHDRSLASGWHGLRLRSRAEAAAEAVRLSSLLAASHFDSPKARAAYAARNRPFVTQARKQREETLRRSRPRAADVGSATSLLPPARRPKSGSPTNPHPPKAAPL